jgi:hypothetical protein
MLTAATKELMPICSFTAGHLGQAVGLQERDRDGIMGKQAQLPAQRHGGDQHGRGNGEELKTALGDLFHGAAEQAQLLDLVRVGAGGKLRRRRDWRCLPHEVLLVDSLNELPAERPQLGWG